MNRFTGHKSLGTWMFRDKYGVWHMLTPNEVMAHDKLQWTNCEGAGDFYWPHIDVDGKLVPLQYDEQQTI